MIVRVASLEVLPTLLLWERYCIIGRCAGRYAVVADTIFAARIAVIDRVIADVSVQIDAVFVADWINLQEAGVAAVLHKIETIPSAEPTVTLACFMIFPFKSARDLH